MEWQTKITLQPSRHTFGYEDKLLFLGSCFSENIGNELMACKMQVTVNPFGIIFHPEPLFRVLKRALIGSEYMGDDLFYHKEQYKCYEAHSKLNHRDETEAVCQLNEARVKLKQAVKEASYIFITLGTAWGYLQQANETIVANCHKVPAQEFTKSISSPENILATLSQIEELIHTTNPEAEVVFTVSPVRHIKDGIVENSRSKAHLLTAIHQLVDKGSSDYFPAFEIMMDELRDYRFYSSDMLHPSSVAIEHILEIVLRKYASQEARDTLKYAQKINKSLQHRPVNIDSEEHRLFLSSLHNNIEKFQKKYPFVSFD